MDDLHFFAVSFFVFGFGVPILGLYLRFKGYYDGGGSHHDAGLFNLTGGQNDSSDHGHFHHHHCDSSSHHGHGGQ